MPTIVESTISLTGTPDYSTLQSWEDGSPVNLVSEDKIWRGVIQEANDSFTGKLTVGGSTTDATRYKELTVKAGSSFVDHASAATNPLRFDATKGASSNRAGTDHNILIGEDYFRVSRLQFNNSTASRAAALISNTGTSGAQVDQCIFETNVSSLPLVAWPGENDSRITNCLFCHRTSSAASLVTLANRVTVSNCTLVVPSNLTAASKGFAITGLTGSEITNVAAFGVLDFADGSIVSTKCYTDESSPPSGVTQVSYNTTTGSGFENITDATRDFRIKSTSALRNTGATTSQTTVDILGTTRPAGGAYDVGAYELPHTAGDGIPGARMLLGVGT